jgi:hypothetical protein
MSDEWRNFGPVEGVFWLGRLGVMLRFGSSLDNYHGSTFVAYRLWPFVFVWAARQ